MHAEYFGLMYQKFRYFVYSEYFGFCVLQNTVRVLRVVRAYLLRNTASTRSISRCSTADTSGHAVFRGSIPAVDTPCTSKCFRVLSVLRVLHLLAAFRPLVLRVIGVL